MLLFLNAQNPTSMYLTGTRVDEWVDQNGSGKSVATAASLGTSYNPTFNASLFGGKGGITFNNKYLESPAAFPELNWKKGFTILIAGTFRSGFFAMSDSVSPIAGIGLGRVLGIGTSCNSKYPLPDVPCVAGVVWDGIKLLFILNGSLYSVTQGTPMPGTAAFGKLQLGGLIGSAGAMDMDIAGIQVFDEELSGYDILERCNALASLYSFADPAKPKYNIVVDGNSLAVGYWSNNKTTMWDGVKGVTGTTPQDMVNVATSGLETLSMSSRAPSTVDNLLNLSVPSKRRVLIVWEITNDLSNLTQTSSAAYANIKSYCQARKAAGWKVIVCTCLPRTQAGINTNFESYRVAVNNLITTNAVSEGWADAVANIGGDATIGSTGASDNTTYFNDKTHMTSAGHLIASTYITSALNAIL